MRRLQLAAAVAAVLFGSALYYAQRTTDTPAADPPPSDGPDQTAKPSPDPEPDPESSQQDSSEKTLELVAKASHGYVPAGRSSRIYSALEVRANEFEEIDRPPLNVALVVDRSGSMRGEKIDHVREAASKVVGRLAKRDRLSIVSYGSRSRLEVEARRVNSDTMPTFRAAIDELGAGGATNLEAGLRTGIEELRRVRSDETVDRVVLLSDGKPTMGASSTETFSELVGRAAEDGFSVTTMGVGVDYNEELMTRIANVGGGRYHFIHSPKRVVAEFENEIASLAETVAEAAELTVEIGDDVRVEDVHGFPHHREDGDLVVSLADFSAGEHKRLLVELKESLPTGRERSLLDAELTYRDLRRDRRARQSAALTAVATDDDEKVAGSVDETVISRVQEVDVATTINRAMDAFERGDRSEAREILDRGRDQVETAQKTYGIDEDRIADERKRLQEAATGVSSASADSGEGKRMIKQQKAESNSLIMRGSSRN